MARTSFQNFDLELSGYTAGPDGRVEFRVRVAMTPRAQVQRLENADRVSIAPGEIDAAVATLTDRWDVDEARFAQACRSLETWLLPPTSRARSLLEASLAALGPGQSLCLRLRCQDTELARLPWEFATFDVTGLPFDGHFYVNRTLAMHPGICLVRFDELATPAQRIVESAARRLVFARASPADLDPLSLAEERERIEKELADANLDAERTWLEHATSESLDRALEDNRCDVFQYSGHGESGEGGFLCLERSGSGEAANFSAGNLGLALADKGVLVAVLAACVTAEIEARLPWSSVARSLEIAGVPAVVGMQLNITDEGALDFLARFHGRLARFMSVAEAVNGARKAIAASSDRDFGVPVLYLRNAGEWDGVVFRAPPEESEFERRVRAADAYKRLHDSLHKAKISAYHLLLGFANDFPPANDRPLKSYVNTMKMCAVEMRGIANETRNERPLVDRDLIDPIIADLERATAQLATSVRDKDSELFVDALLQLDPIFHVNMAMLDVLLHNTAKDLDASLRLQLKQLIDDMKKRVVTHHACQRLESMLDELRDKRKMDVVNVGILKRRLQDLKALLDTFLPSLDEATASSLRERFSVLNQSLGSTDTDELTEAYEYFCSEVGMSFFKIDSDLKGTCAKLCADPQLGVQ